MAQAPAPKKSAAPNYIPKAAPVDVKVQEVRTVLVEYRDDSNRQVIQLAIVGKNNVQLLDGHPIGLANGTQRSGLASSTLRDAVFAHLGIPSPGNEEKENGAEIEVKKP